MWKVWFWKNQYICFSQRFPEFFIFERVFVFDLMRKWNISCTAIDSQYVFKKLPHLFNLSQTEGGFTREEIHLESYILLNKFLNTDL